MGSRGRLESGKKIGEGGKVDGWGDEEGSQILDVVVVVVVTSDRFIVIIDADEQWRQYSGGNLCGGTTGRRVGGGVRADQQGPM